MVQRTSRYVLAYLLWAVSVATAILILLNSRTSVMLALGVTQWDRYVEHALNQFGFLFLAIFGLSIIVFTEHYYRTGVEKGKLFSRFFLMSFWELLVLTLVQLAALLSMIQLNLFSADRLFWVIGEVVLCVLLYWLYRRARQAYVAPVL